MFDALQSRFQKVFKSLRVQGILSEDVVDENLREVRLALLEADVSLNVVKALLDRVRVKAMGEEIRSSLSPGQEVIRIVRDELIEILGREASLLTFSKEYPTVFLLVGLQGSGKTTTAGKLALWLSSRKRRPMLVSTDVYRPAAREQLAVIAKAIQLPCYAGQEMDSPIDLALAARRDAADRGHDVLIVDTAGRLHIDEQMMQEVSDLRTRLRPSEVLLVADAMVGQDAVRSAQEFHERLGTSGVILTKLDGDARGGAALSMRTVTGKPIKFAGVGEKLDDLEPFYAERMAGRILGMGDVVGLVEKAQEAFDLKNTEEMQQKIANQSLNFDDFLGQLQQLKKLGPLENLLGMLPGMSKMQDLGPGDSQLKRVEAIVQSMTREERRRPEILNASRRTRIARGSGTTVAEVNDLLKQFGMMKRMMKDMGKMQKAMMRKGALPKLAP